MVTFFGKLFGGGGGGGWRRIAHNYYTITVVVEVA